MSTPRRWEQPVVGLASVLFVLGLWEGAVRGGAVNAQFVSSPTLIARAGWRLYASGEMWHHLAVSGIEFVAGYGGAVVIAIPLGLALGWYPRLYYLVAPFVDALNAVPRVALLPVIVIWFGIWIWSKIVVVFLGAVIPLLINTFSGVKVVDGRLLRVARSFGASELRIFWTIVLPGTLPFIFTGLKYAAGRALLGVVVGELFASTAGVGYLINVAGSSVQTDIVFVGILTITAAGVITVAILNRLERRFDQWRPRASVGQ